MAKNEKVSSRRNTKGEGVAGKLFDKEIMHRDSWTSSAISVEARNRGGIRIVYPSIYLPTYLPPSLTLSTEKIESKR